MATIEQQIAIKIKAIVQGLTEVQALSSSVKSLNKAGNNSGINGLSQSVANFTSNAANAKNKSAELVTSFETLAKTVSNPQALGVFVKSLKDAAVELKAAEESSRLLANSPFEQGLRGSKLQTASQSGKDLASYEQKLSLVNQASKELQSGLLRNDPFQTQSISIGKAANELKNYENTLKQGQSSLEGQLLKHDPFQTQGISLASAAKELKNYESYAKSTTQTKKLLEVEAEKVSTSFLGMKVSAEGLAGSLLSLGVNGAALLAILGAVGAGAVAVGFAELAKEGIRFNGSIEKSKIGMASLIASTTDIKDSQGKAVLGMDAFRAASGLAETEVKKIQKAAIETTYQFEDILLTVNSAIAAGAGANLTIDKTVSLVTTLSRAASAINLDPSKFNTQVKQILSGATTLRTDLARIIFPGQGSKEINEQLKGFRQAGTLYEELTKRAKIYELTANDVAGTFTALANNAQDALSQFASEATLRLFDSVKTILSEIVHNVIDFSSETVKLTPTFQEIADVLNIIYGIIGDKLLQYTNDIFGYLQGWADYLFQNKDAVESITSSVIVIGEQLAGIVGDTATIAGDSAHAATSTVTWTSALQYVALFVAVIRDGFNIVVGTIETLVGLFWFGVGTGLSNISSTISNIVNSTGSWLGELLRTVAPLLRIAGIIAYISGWIASTGKDVLNSGLDRVSDGLNGTNFNSALDALNTKSSPTDKKKPDNKGFSFNPRHIQNEDESAAKKAAREREKQLTAARELANADADARIERAKTVYETEKALNDLSLKSLQRRYEGGLESSDDYYNAQEQLRDKDLDAEKKYLEKKQSLEEQKVRREVATLYGKFDFTDEEFQNFTDDFYARQKGENGGFDAQNSKQIKAATLFTKYLKEQMQVQFDLDGIERKRKENETDKTFEIEKQNRALKQQSRDLEGQLASNFDNTGQADLLADYKRISDELPKLLLDTNPVTENLKEAAKQIRDLGSVDLASLPKIFKESGVDVEGLSKDTQNFIKLMERLVFLSTNKQIGVDVTKIQGNLSEDSKTVSDQADRGEITRAQERQQLLVLNVAAAQQLKDELTALDAYIAESESKGIVTDKEKRTANALRRAIPLVQSQGVLGSFNQDVTENENVFAQKRVDLQQQFNLGKINEIELRNQSIEINLQEKAALDALIAQMEKLPNLTTEQSQAIQQLKNKSSELGTVTDQFASSINGVLVDSVNGLYDAFTNATDGIGQALQKLAADTLLQLGKIIFQALVVQSILAALGIKGGNTSGGLGGFLSGLFGAAPVKHAEGTSFVQGAGTSISDSVPALLSHGEAVLPANSVRLYGRSMIQSLIDGRFMPKIRLAAGGILGDGATDLGAGSSNRLRILNILDPSLVGDFMNSSAGEEAILNVIAKNGRGINQMLVGA